MLKAATTAARSPRGTKPVSQAFFAALESIPEASRAAVAKAALTMIRDEMKTRKEKLKVAAAKEKARTPPAPKAAPAKATAKKAAPAKRAPKAAAPEMPEAAPAPAPTNGVSAPKRRGRKPAADTTAE